MLCAMCDNDMFIKKSRYEISGDKSPDTKTKVDVRHCFVCVNKSCGGYEREVEGEAIRLF